MTKEDIISHIASLPVDITQEEMQKELQNIFEAHGLEFVMDALFAWEMKTGYITKSKLEDNEHLSFYDEEYGISFRIQINLARSNYKPVPLQGKNIPELYSPITIENVGIPGKENLRVFIFSLDGGERKFFVQVTPFPLFNNHYVLINLEKVPQKISPQTIEDLFNFVKLSPHYTACSNSDLAWTGASILKHMHYQVFDSLVLPVMEAKDDDKYVIHVKDTKISALHYPLGVVKVSGQEESVKSLMAKVIENWRDENREKNSVNLIVVKTETGFDGYIFLRNQDHRTPDSLQRIKSEGVGIIEVAGEGILPVPKGDDAEEIWKEIRENGLSVIKGIIEGNNPIKDRTFFDKFLKKLV